ncbi:uncharacterized protein LOC111272688 [Varroa jacobsoni]|uniref:uncharacterized protein LOC111272688 n=1 Tax=Varroa jacobsoni TaxID=62625 RepID=UPI000BF29AF5|nr:uncharacterized protein LOC111272688 [Varroa jacobsoni]XP_022710006.1 uncharacterized protein LOC111272688 [Varroa jacobsoni]
MSTPRSGLPKADASNYRIRTLRDGFECPVCRRVRASDWDGLHSHIVNVHHVDLDELFDVRQEERQPWNKPQMVSDRAELTHHNPHIRPTAHYNSRSEMVGFDHHHTPELCRRKSVPHVDVRVRRKGRETSTPKVNQGRNGRAVRYKRRPLCLRCPVCTCVWAADFEGICSHASVVHRIRLDNYTMIKDLLALRAERLSSINVDTPDDYLCCVKDRQQVTDPQFEMRLEATSHLLHTSSQANAPNSDQDTSPAQLDAEPDFERQAAAARREVRSLSDFGIHYTLESYPVRKRSASMIHLSPPQLENVYQAHRQLRARRQLEAKYKLQQDDKSHIFALVRPTAEDKIAEIDFKIAKCLIGGYAIPPNSRLDSIQEDADPKVQLFN